MTYNTQPETKIENFDLALEGAKSIVTELKKKLNKTDKSKKILVIDNYIGVDNKQILEQIVKPLKPDHMFFADEYALSGSQINDRVKEYLTDDRVFGRMMYYNLSEFYPNIEKIKEEVQKNNGLTVVYGTGASLIAPKADVIVYSDISRWEIQLRYRKGMPNWKQTNKDEDPLRKVKRGHFFEWRMMDQYKIELFKKADFVIDANDPTLRMTTTKDLLNALLKISKQPFRTVPYFDASVWGGQWMKNHYHLPENGSNYGWAFDGVPEENSLFLRMGDVRLQFPAMDLVLLQPRNLLGEKVYARFGAEYPIRFDYLDTMQGGNLSLQVHPLTEYIKKHYGMTYTQDESYYILQATDHSSVYLGVKDNINPKEMKKDLIAGAQGKKRFPDEKYINHFPAKRGDHFLIPAGTVHCGGKDTLILEISATPYIFTFKIWDWGRIGLDGKPRPIHIKEGMDNLQLYRNTEWTKKHLINQITPIRNNQYEKVERTGLHPTLEFIDCHRHWINTVGHFNSHGSVNMLNLVYGNKAIVKSIDGSFEPYKVSFGETFIVPASVNEYLIENPNPKDKIGVLQTFVH